MNIDLAKYFNKIDNDNMFKINNNVYFLIPNNSHSMFLIYSQLYNSKINKNNHIQQMKFNLLNKINILENIRNIECELLGIRKYTLLLILNILSLSILLKYFAKSIF